MAGHTLLLNLLGGVALLLWATQMVRKGVMDAFGAKLRHAIARATNGRLRACATGVGVATALQSSSATGLLVVAFAERGLIALAPGARRDARRRYRLDHRRPGPLAQIRGLAPALLLVGVGLVMIVEDELLAAYRPDRDRSCAHDPVARPHRRGVPAVARAGHLHPRDAAPRRRSGPGARHGGAVHLGRPFERRGRSCS